MLTYRDRQSSCNGAAHAAAGALPIVIGQTVQHSDVNAAAVNVGCTWFYVADPFLAFDVTGAVRGALHRLEI